MDENNCLERYGDTLIIFNNDIKEDIFCYFGDSFSRYRVHGNNTGTNFPFNTPSLF